MHIKFNHYRKVRRDVYAPINDTMARYEGGLSCWIHGPTVATKYTKQIFLAKSACTLHSPFCTQNWQSPLCMLTCNKSLLVACCHHHMNARCRAWRQLADILNHTLMLAACSNPLEEYAYRNMQADSANKIFLRQITLTPIDVTCNIYLTHSQINHSYTDKSIQFLSTLLCHI